MAMRLDNAGRSRLRCSRVGSVFARSLPARLRLITARTLLQYAEEHPDVRDELTRLIRFLEVAAWTDATHLKETCPFPARPIGAKRVVFNIKGNHYRVICAVRYASPPHGLQGVVLVHFVGTHAEYDRVDAETVTFQ